MGMAARLHARGAGVGRAARTASSSTAISASLSSPVPCFSALPCMSGAGQTPAALPSWIAWQHALPYRRRLHRSRALRSRHALPPGRRHSPSPPPSRRARATDRRNLLPRRLPPERRLSGAPWPCPARGLRTSPDRGSYGCCGAPGGSISGPTTQRGGRQKEFASWKSAASRGACSRSSAPSS